MVLSAIHRHDYGGRRRSAKFDEKKYINTVFDNMASMAKNDAKEELASELEVIKILLNASSSEERQGALNLGLFGTA